MSGRRPAFSSYYEKVVTLHCVEGWDVTILWEGVLIEDLLVEAGVQDGAVTLIFHAADGYTSSLPLDLIRQNDIMLAYKMNGVTLPPERGFPFQVVAQSKWGYKWVKWVTNAPDTRALLEVCTSGYRPHQVVAAGVTGAIPLLAGRGQIEGHATAYVCVDCVCRPPLTDPTVLQKSMYLACDTLCPSLRLLCPGL